MSLTEKEHERFWARASLALRSANAMSYEDLREQLNEALVDKFGRDENGMRRYRIVETFPSYLIASGSEDGLYQVPYAVAADDSITFGDPHEVETAYIPVQQSACFLAAASSGGDQDGWVWPVQIMKAGVGTGTVTRNGKVLAVKQHYGPKVVAEVAAAANGARVGRRHPVTAGEEQDPARICGWLSEAKVSGDTALAMLNLLRSEGELRAKLMAAREAGKLDLFGMSVLGIFQYVPGKLNGEDILDATSLGKLITVDICGEPAAGGRIFSFDARLAASQNLLAEIAQLQSAAKKNSPQGAKPGSPEGGRKGAQMKPRILALLTALAVLDAGRATELKTEFEALAEEDQQAEFLGKVTEAFSAVAANANHSTLTEAKAALAEAQRVQEINKKSIFKNTLEAKLTASKLPVPAVTLVRAHYLNDKGDVVTLADDASIDADITRTRDAFAAFSSVGRIGNQGVVVTLDGADRVQLAMDQLLGVKEANGKGVPAFRSIKQAYIHLTGDHDCTFGNGGFYRSALAADGIASTGDFPNILLDAMHKRLLQEWAELGSQGLDMLYTVGAGFTDFRAQYRMRDGYFADFNTVAEGADYPVINEPTDEKVSFTGAKKGGILTINEETIRNDDLGAIARWPNKLVRAWRHMTKAIITAHFTANAAYGADATAWFHATHGNLGSAALSVDELNAREVAIMTQTEKDSGNPLGLTLDWIMIPPALKAVAYQINRSQYITGQIGVANPWYQRFGASEERIIVNSLLADANDWYYGTMPANAPFLEVSFLDGVELPQILMANDPRIGKMFTADQIQYKVKGGIGSVKTDYRGVGKNVVA